jgi:hypothetical protein
LNSEHTDPQEEPDVVQPDEPATTGDPAKKAPAKKAPAKKAPAKAAAKKAPATTGPTTQPAEQVTPAAPQPLPADHAPKLAGGPVATTTSLPSSGSERSRLPLLAGVGMLLLVVRKLRKLRRR